MAQLLDQIMMENNKFSINSFIIYKSSEHYFPSKLEQKRSLSKTTTKVETNVSSISKSGYSTVSNNHKTKNGCQIKSEFSFQNN